jgi:hypothetical protein
VQADALDGADSEHRPGGPLLSEAFRCWCRLLFCLPHNSAGGCRRIAARTIKFGVVATVAANCPQSASGGVFARPPMRRPRRRRWPCWRYRRGAACPNKGRHGVVLERKGTRVSTSANRCGHFRSVAWRRRRGDHVRAWMDLDDPTA